MNKALEYIASVILMALGVVVLQHSLNDNFFIQWVVTISGLALILVGNRWRENILGE